MDPEIEQFFKKTKKWNAELQLLRSIILECKLDETYKWMHPCYTYNAANIALIHGFKEYCGVLFFKGVLLKDPNKILIQQTKNVQDRRQIRFTNLEQIKAAKKVIQVYIREAIEIEKAGLKVEFKKTEDFDMPKEFKARLRKNSSLKKAFNALTPGRQRAYLLFFSAAKLSSTREARIDKYEQAILCGKGLQD